MALVESFRGPTNYWGNEERIQLILRFDSTKRTMEKYSH